jgi:choline kinase
VSTYWNHGLLIDMINYQSQNHSITKSQLSRCVILAAGASLRLRPLTDSKPKCLLEVGGKALLKRIIENVLDAGVKEIAVVIGYRGEMIREFVRQHFPQIHIRFILNPNYANTNNAYSLFLTKKFLENKKGNVSSGLILLDSDLYFSSKLLPIFLSNSLQDCVAVRVSGEHCEEEIRVKADSYGNIILIGKETPLNETYGESIGIEVFSTETTACLFTILEKRVKSGTGRTEFYEASFQEMINHGIQIKAIDVSAFPAIEIDTVEDLQLAERMNIV